jgi:uncharacterized membrane protein (DUF4010 family)
MEGLIARLGLALAIGLVIGAERGWRAREAAPGSRTAGIRTFGLVALLGGAAAALGQAANNPAVLPAALLACAGAFGWFAAREAERRQQASVTGLIAALAAFVLGALAVAGDMRAAAAGGVATAGVLAYREALHGVLQRLTWPEIRSALVLLAMSAIILPLAPDRAIDPWGMVNPREVWLFTVLAAALSFAGYVAVRLLGETAGLLLTSLAGALVSSTAVTLTLARRAATGGGPPAMLAGIAALAGTVSVVRVVTLVQVLAPTLLPAVAPAALAGAAILGVGGAMLLRIPAGDDGAAPAQRLGNPLDLVALLGFALGLAAVSALGGWLAERLGSTGLYGSAAVIALADVDVSVLGATKLAAAGTITPEIAARIVLVALAANAAARACYAVLVGSARFSLILVGLTLAALGGGLVLALA